MVDELGEIQQNPSGFKKGVAVGAAAVAVAAGSIFAVDRTIENSQDSNSGTPIENSQPFEISLHHITNNQKQDIAPTFREKPTQDSKELTPDALRGKGIDPNAHNLTIREVKGSTYPSPLKAGFVEDVKTGKNYGVWGEIMVGDKPTGIYVSENFTEKVKQEPSQNPNKQ